MEMMGKMNMANDNIPAGDGLATLQISNIAMNMVINAASRLTALIVGKYNNEQLHDDILDAAITVTLSNIAVGMRTETHPDAFGATQVFLEYMNQPGRMEALCEAALHNDLLDHTDTDARIYKLAGIANNLSCGLDRDTLSEMIAVRLQQDASLADALVHVLNQSCKIGYNSTENAVKVA